MHEANIFSEKSNISRSIFFFRHFFLLHFDLSLFWERRCHSEFKILHFHSPDTLENLQKNMTHCADYIDYLKQMLKLPQWTDNFIGVLSFILCPLTENLFLNIPSLFSVAAPFLIQGERSHIWEAEDKEEEEGERSKWTNEYFANSS